MVGRSVRNFTRRAHREWSSSSAAAQNDYIYATGDTGDAGYAGDMRSRRRERGKRVSKSQISRPLVGGTRSVSLQTHKQRNSRQSSSITSYKRKNEPSYKRHSITKFSNDIDIVIIFVIQRVDRGQNSKDVHSGLYLSPTCCF